MVRLRHSLSALGIERVSIESVISIEIKRPANLRTPNGVALAGTVI